ncbi:hypothetical protein HDV00_008393 [Rhizophlyctis rosea]|nr:hypothetical protein HDV00_008393 [Rhizophlyctis rosea]
MFMKTAVIALSALALVDAASYQKPTKGPETLDFPITKDGKKLKTGFVLDNGWFDSEKQIPGIFPNSIKTFAEAGIVKLPGDAVRFTKPIARVYLVNEKRDKYEMLNLNGKTISFEVDLSGVPCGYNAAGYTTGLNPKAKIGEGYCDGQNFCNEMDLLESNIGSQAYTPHPCTDAKHINGTTKCDPWGCADNAYKNHLAHYGPGKHIDSLKPFRVYTQFDGAKDTYVTRAWMKQGKNVVRFIDMTDSYCDTTNPFWRNNNATASLPAPVLCPTCDYKPLEASYKNGHVLTFSFWGTGGEGMSWLDGGATNPNCAYNTTLSGFTLRDVVVEKNFLPPVTNA